jgi:hypothetical protein
MMLLSTRRFKDTQCKKRFTQRTWKEKLLFWKDYYYYVLVEITPDSPEYATAPFQEVIYVDTGPLKSELYLQ